MTQKIDAGIFNLGNSFKETSVGNISRESSDYTDLSSTAFYCHRLSVLKVTGFNCVSVSACKRYPSERAGFGDWWPDLTGAGLSVILEVVMMRRPFTCAPPTHPVHRSRKINGGNKDKQQHTEPLPPPSFGFSFVSASRFFGTTRADWIPRSSS